MSSRALEAAEAGPRHFGDRPEAGPSHLADPVLVGTAPIVGAGGGSATPHPTP